MGGYYGSGRRGGGIITHFLLGLEVSPKPGGSGRREYHSFTRVGSGYSMKELNDLGSAIGQIATNQSWKDLHTRWALTRTELK